MSEKQSRNIQLEEADRVEVTTIIDNYSESTLPMTEPPSEMIKRAPLAVEGRIPSDTLLAEHGLSLLVKVFKGNDEHSVLLDTGWSKTGVLHNMKRIRVDTSQIEAIVISHGHMDHFGALPALLESMTSQAISVIIHPDAFLQRALSLPTGVKIEFPLLEEAALEKTSANVVKTKEPHRLASGLVYSLGEIERVTDFEKGMPAAVIKRDGEFRPDSILDDHGLAMCIKGKGLVIITGCAHSGVVNTVKYAQKITGINDVYAIMGGFHLTGPEFKPLTDRTIEELTKINPAVVIPMHCNCWMATNQIARELPDQFKLNSVGTTFCF